MYLCIFQITVVEKCVIIPQSQPSVLMGPPSHLKIVPFQIPVANDWTNLEGIELATAIPPLHPALEPYTAA